MPTYLRFSRLEDLHKSRDASRVLQYRFHSQFRLSNRLRIWLCENYQEVCHRGSIWRKDCHTRDASSTYRNAFFPQVTEGFPLFGSKTRKGNRIINDGSMQHGYQLKRFVPIMESKTKTNKNICAPMPVVA